MERAPGDREARGAPLTPRLVQRHFAIGLTRAAGGALLFSLPLLTTEEMWGFGATLSGLRLAILVAITLPLLAGLSTISGFQPTYGLLDDVVDAFVAFAVGFVVAAFGLALIGELGMDAPLHETLGKIGVQTVPASIGALLAQSELGRERDERAPARAPTTYGRELFEMTVGALFIGLPVAPTDEMIAIAHHIESWRAIALVITSLAVMHAFVYASDFAGAPTRPTLALGLFTRFTVVGYVIALAVSAYLLWTFERLSGKGLGDALASIVVLAFPASIGAAAARLLL